MSNLHNFLGHKNDNIIISREQTKHKNREKMETKDTWFFKESFFDRSYLVLEILSLSPVPQETTNVNVRSLTTEPFVTLSIIYGKETEEW